MPPPPLPSPIAGQGQEGTEEEEENGKITWGKGEVGSALGEANRGKITLEHPRRDGREQ